MILRKLLALTTLLLLGLLVGCSGGDNEMADESADMDTGGAEFMVDPATAGAIAGKVSFSGTPPKRRPIEMGAEASCAAAHGGQAMSEDFVPGKNGTLQNVFVYVKDEAINAAKFEPPAEPVELDQKNCLYTPHVVGAMAGQTIKYVNSDTVTHNVHPVPQNNREWNKSQPGQGDPIEEPFARPEMAVAVKCNVHPWMRSYVHVMSHPYFDVTGEDGTFEIKNLPPGEYTLIAWQEKFGEQEMKVTVPESGTAEVEFTYASN